MIKYVIKLYIYKGNKNKDDLFSFYIAILIFLGGGAFKQLLTIYKQSETD